MNIAHIVFRSCLTGRTPGEIEKHFSFLKLRDPKLLLLLKPLYNPSVHQPKYSNKKERNSYKVGKGQLAGKVLG